MCLNQALEHMSVNTLDNMSHIIKTNGSSVTHTNCITLSPRFQTYVQALQNMIPTMITTTIPSNTWKCHPPAVLNYNDEEYPSIDGSKKQRTMDTELMDNSSTNVDTAGDTLTTIDLDELQSAYETKCEAIRTQLQLQIKEQCSAMEQMKQQLQLNFKRQIQQLELKMETNAKQLFQDFGQCFQVVMDKIEELVLDRTELRP